LLFFERGNVPPRTGIAIGILGVLVCLTKMNYAPLTALPLLIADARFRSKASAWRARFVYAGIIALAFVTATLIVARNWTSFRTGVSNPHLQFEFILGHPLAFAKVLWLEHVIHAKSYLVSMVGDLGTDPWTLRLPRILIAAYFAGAAALLFGDTNSRVKVSALHRLSLGVICAALILAIA